MSFNPRGGKRQARPYPFAGSSLVPRQTIAAELSFALAEPALAWVQNPNYTAQRMGPDFTDRYGYVELVGPQRIFESRTLLSGSCCWAAHALPRPRARS